MGGFFIQEDLKVKLGNPQKQKSIVNRIFYIVSFTQSLAHKPHCG